MNRILKFFFFSILFFLGIKGTAYANISPLNIKPDGVEPVKNKNVILDSAEISVTPTGNSFIFNCKYSLKSDSDIEELVLGIPGDLGYTLEAGYIENLNISVDGNPVKYEILNTTEQLSIPVEDRKTSLQFKWHVFKIPVKKDVITNITAIYNVSWRISEQNKSSNYYIIPFTLSTDSFFGSSSGKYKITYINDDYISPADVKVMISSMLEPDIVSQAILNPKYDSSSIIWEFYDDSEFQDFRLVVLSFRKIAMEFSTDTAIDHSIKWALLNNNYSRLASLFEEIAKNKLSQDLSSDKLGCAAYLASEFYFRSLDYDKALEMLMLPNKTTLWPVSIKYAYIESVKLKQDGDYALLLDVLKKLSGYRDYILVSNSAEQQIRPIEELLAMQEFEKNNAAAQVPEQKPATENNIKYIFILAGVLVLSLIVIIIYRIIIIKRKKTFW